MRALTHSSFGDPAQVMSVREAPERPLGAGEARVRLLLSPIHNHDSLTVRGLYGYKPELPAGGGTEAVGVVEELGDGVDGLSVGQRVLSTATFGVWAETFVAPAATLVPVPDGMADEAAAQLGSMPLSALSVVDSLGLQAGAWLATNAGNGAVGRLVAQFAASRGLNVVSLVRRSTAVAELEAQGVSGAVATDDEAWRERVASLTGGAPIAAGIDQVGGEAANELLSLLAEGGELVIFGAMSAANLTLSSAALIFGQLGVRGFWGSKVIAGMDAQHRATLLAEVMRAVAAGTVTLPVAGVFTLDDAAAAFAAHEAPGRVGKVLLRP